MRTILIKIKPEITYPCPACGSVFYHKKFLRFHITQCENLYLRGVKDDDKIKIIFLKHD